MKTTITNLFALATVLLPAITSAQGLNDTSLAGYADSIIAFINSTLVPLLFAIAFIVFIFNVIRFFIFGGSNEDSQKSGWRFIFYGLAGFVIIISIWGIVNLLAQSLGLDQGLDPSLIPNALF